VIKEDLYGGWGVAFRISEGGSYRRGGGGGAEDGSVADWTAARGMTGGPTRGG